MAGPLNKIGSFQFVSLAGDPTSLREEVEMVRRPGVDGLGFWKTGTRGRPFRLVSGVDAPNMVQARVLYKQYKTLIGADPVFLIWAGVNITSLESVKVVVLDVRPAGGRRTAVRRIGNSVGTLNSNPQAWIDAEWTLVSVST